MGPHGLLLVREAARLVQEPVIRIEVRAPSTIVASGPVEAKRTLRLAQKPAAYVVLKVIRPVVKRKSDGTLSYPPAPPSVLGKSVADVSLLACLAIDKFRYHLARSTLTDLMHRSGDLLMPIYRAQVDSVVASSTDTALEHIRNLYEAEAQLELRALHCKPIVDAFFEWLKTVLEERILLPRNPFTAAAGHALAREKQLQVFLEYLDVPIALGRRNWLFGWTEIGAQYVGVFQRVESHPASDAVT